MKKGLNFKILIISGILLLIFQSCNSSNNPLTTNVSINNEFKIKYGESAIIPEENLYIYFQDVVEESRCPEGLHCFQQGTAKLELFIRLGNDTLTDTVETYLPQSIVSIGPINNSYLFDVKDVQPYPKQNVSVDVHNYVLTLKVSHYTYGFSDSEIKNKTGLFGQVYITGGPVIIDGLISEFPYQTKFQFVSSNYDTVDVQTDSTGKFISYVNAGDYHLAQVKGLPSLNDTRVFTVSEGKMSYINIYFDSGIR